MSKRSFFLAIVSILGLFLVGCGSSESGQGGQQTQASTSQTTAISATTTQPATTQKTTATPSATTAPTQTQSEQAQQAQSQSNSQAAGTAKQQIQPDSATQARLLRGTDGFYYNLSLGQINLATSLCDEAGRELVNKLYGNNEFQKQLGGNLLRTDNPQITAYDGTDAMVQIGIGAMDRQGTLGVFHKQALDSLRSTALEYAGYQYYLVEVVRGSLLS